MLCRLLIRIDKLDKIRFAEQAAYKGQAGRQDIARMPHRDRNGGKTGVGRQVLAVVACRAICIPHPTRRITPGRVDDRVDIMGVHRLEDGIPENDVLFTVK